MEYVKNSMDILSGLDEYIESQFGSSPRWKVIGTSVTVTVGLCWLREIVRTREDLYESIPRRLYRIVKRIPQLQKKITSEMDIAKKEMIGEIFLKEERHLEAFDVIPQIGKSSEEVIELAGKILKLGKYDWEGGKISGGTFAGKNAEYTKLMSETYRIFCLSNPLHADVFPGVTKMESEIIAMTAKIFHGDSETVGCVTSGGSESLMMALKSARDYGTKVRGVRSPEAVLSVTCHAAVEKGCSLMGIRCRKVPIDPVSFKCDPAAIERAITRNTVLVVGSATDFSYGIIDDLEAFSKICLKKNIPLHVDCCLGGFILPFMAAAGYTLPPFDFRLKGVTSISADTHKYGNSPKGTSVLLYRKKELRHYQYFVFPDWPGGIYATATIPGSRAGAHIAMCWAAMVSHGFDGYVNKTKKIIDVARYLKKEFGNIAGIRVNGDPLGSVVSISSDQIDILQVCDKMGQKGWHLQPLQYPFAMHIFLTSLHTKEGLKEELVKDLREAVDYALKNPGPADHGLAKMYGLAHSIPKVIQREVIDIYQDLYYSLVGEV